MNAAVVLIAAGFDWLQELLPLLFVLYWIGSQLVGLFRAAGGDRKPVARVPAPPRPPAADEVRGELERQIEEFLRQAPARAGEQAGRREAAGRDTRRPPRKARSTPPPPLPQARQPASSTTVGGRHLGALEAGGPDVASHVHDAFAHDLGRLTTSLARERPQVATAAPAGTPAADLVALLRSPTTLRQLFVVREVLDRPVDRW
jgi:hypothetical protein